MNTDTRQSGGLADLQARRKCKICGYIRPDPACDDDRVIAFGVCEDCSRDDHEADDRDYPDDD